MAVTRKRLPQLWQPLPCGRRQTVRLSAFPSYIAPGTRASWTATGLAGTRHAPGRWPHVAAAAVMDFAFTALSPHASCDTRRKPQTPGTAEEHKRQGTPRQLCPRHELRSYRSGMRSYRSGMRVPPVWHACATGPPEAQEGQETACRRRVSHGCQQHAPGIEPWLPSELSHRLRDPCSCVSLDGGPGAAAAVTHLLARGAALDPAGVFSRKNGPARTARLHA